MYYAGKPGGPNGDFKRAYYVTQQMTQVPPKPSQVDLDPDVKGNLQRWTPGATLSSRIA